MTPLRRLAATLLLLSLAARASDDDPLAVARALSRARAAAVARVLPSVVSVRAYGRPSPKETPSGDDAGYGGGLVVRKEGFVLTALHVVEGAAAIGVRLPSGDEHPAKIHAVDGPSDLALLRILEPGLELPVAPLGDDRALLVGETLLAVGNPFGLAGTVTEGILSARGRRGVVEGTVVPLLQTDAAINPGCSGGVLVSLHGEVIGLVTAILTRTGGNQGIGFAVPATEIRRALPALLENRPVRRSWIGVQVRTSRGRTRGVAVLAVAPGGPAEKAGVRPGDRLVELAGRRITSLQELRRCLGDLEPGREIRAVVRRGRSTHEVRLRVDVRAD